MRRRLPVTERARSVLPLGRHAPTPAGDRAGTFRPPRRFPATRNTRSAAHPRHVLPARDGGSTDGRAAPVTAGRRPDGTPGRTQPRRSHAAAPVAQHAARDRPGRTTCRPVAQRTACPATRTATANTGHPRQRRPRGSGGAVDGANHRGAARRRRRRARRPTPARRGTSGAESALREWSLGESNSRHPACKAGALPTELRPREDQRTGPGGKWWGYKDLNLGPLRYQRSALTA